MYTKDEIRLLNAIKIAGVFGQLFSEKKSTFLLSATSKTALQYLYYSVRCKVVPEDIYAIACIFHINSYIYVRVYLLQLHHLPIPLQLQLVQQHLQAEHEHQLKRRKINLHLAIIMVIAVIN